MSPGCAGVAGQRVADDPQPPDVVRDIPAALQLAAGEAAFGHARVERRERVVVEGDVEAGCVAGDESVGAAEQAPERLAGVLGLDVPERHVEGAEPAEGRAAVTGLEDAREHAVVEGGDGARILALDRGEEAVDVLDRSGAVAGDAGVGLDRDDRRLGDAGGDVSVDVADRVAPSRGSCGGSGIP